MTVTLGLNLGLARLALLHVVLSEFLYCTMKAIHVP